MKNEIKINGTQKFMGMDIPVIEGGFGEDQKVILARTVAEIHGVRMNDIQDLIIQNYDEFEIGVDVLDLCDDNFKTEAIGLGFITSNRQKHCYLLSEQGYVLLVGFMRTDKAKEIRKNLRREYFTMRQIINSDEQLTANLLLSIYKGGQDAVVASKKLSELEVAKATAQLIPKAEYHDNVLNKDGLITTTVIAKDLGLRSAMRLNQIMNRNNIIYKKSSGTWCPYADYEWLINEKYADYQSYENDNSAPCLKWTEKGRKWIIENFDSWAK